MRSYDKNFEMFSAMLNALSGDKDIIVLSETWNTENEDPLWYMEGYNAYHTARQDRRSGKVSVFCKDNLPIKHINILSVSTQVIE